MITGRLPWPRCKHCGSDLYGKRECRCTGAAIERDDEDDDDA
jgi:hypothetical protein